jgi:hypothetical protein
MSPNFSTLRENLKKPDLTLTGRLLSNWRLSGFVDKLITTGWFSTKWTPEWEIGWLFGWFYPSLHQVGGEGPNGFLKPAFHVKKIETRWVYIEQGDQIGRIFAQQLWSLSLGINLKIAEVSIIFGLPTLFHSWVYASTFTKLSWDKFWVIFS